MSRWFDRYGFAEVHPGLWIGAYPQDHDDTRELRRRGIMRVLNLVQDTEYKPGRREMIATALADYDLPETRITLTDFGSLPTGPLDRAIATVSGWLAHDEPCYVHCRAGHQRSASVAAGVIALTEDIPVAQALERVGERREGADPLPHQRADLAAWWEDRHTGAGAGTRARAA